MIKLPPLDLYAGDTADRNSTNFPKRPNGLGYIDTEADVLYVHVGGSWRGLGASGIPEPPDDAVTYGRKTDGSSSWEAVVPKSGGAFSGTVEISLGGLLVNGGIRLGDVGALYTNTSDGSDNSSISVAGGGSVNNTRGAHYTVFGNEFPTSFAGAMLFYAGDVSTGDIHFYTQGTQRMHIDYGGVTTINSGAVINGGVVFNEPGAAVNTRIESDGNANMVFVDGTNSRVGFGTGTPLRTVHIVGGSGAVASFPASLGVADFMLFENAGNMNMAFVSDPSSSAGIKFYKSATAAFQGLILYNHTNDTFQFQTAATARVTIGPGLVVGSPTGGDKGAGTVNAQAIYDDNTLLTDHIFDLHYDGRMSKADKKKYPNARLWSIEETAVFAKANRHLPTMPGREVWLSAGPRSVGELVTRLWETVEQQQLQIFELDNKLKAVTSGK